MGSKNRSGKHFFLLVLNHQARPLLLASVIFLLLIVQSCKNDMSKIKEITNTEHKPGVVAEGFEMLFSDSSVIRFKLQTPKLITHENEKEPYTEFPEGVKIEKYDTRMNIISSITAQYAKQFTADERWEVKNNVIAVTPKGDTLKTEYLVWDTRKEKIYSDQFVKIIQKDQIYTGIGFESNQDFSIYHIINLQGHIYVNIDN